jgi:hypothetical protein
MLGLKRVSVQKNLDHPNGLPPAGKGFKVAEAGNLPFICWSILEKPKAVPSVPKVPTP